MATSRRKKEMKITVRVGQGFMPCVACKPEGLPYGSGLLHGRSIERPYVPNRRQTSDERRYGPRYRQTIDDSQVKTILHRRGAFNRGTKLLISVLAICTCAFGGQIDHEVQFRAEDIWFKSVQGFDLVGLTGCGFSHRVGAPSLPRAVIRVSIPPGARITGISVIESHKETLPGNYRIYPGQPSQPISYKTDKRWIQPDREIYSRSTPVPGILCEEAHTGNMRGHTIAGIIVHPLQWTPGTGAIEFYSRFVIRITYQGGDKGTTIPGWSDRVKALVVNPEDVDRWGARLSFGNSSALLPDTADYVVITSSQFVSGFEPLVEWKTKKGVPAKTVTLDWIYSNFTGVDEPEQIRNFIKDAVVTWGTDWILLGGQCDWENGEEIVPRRDTWYMDFDVGHCPDEDTIPCDLYFSDLDGTWNDNANGTWGESSDGVDFYADVFVGRAPIKIAQHVQTFVEKTLTYEKNPPSGYLKRIALPAGKLFAWHDGTWVQNEIANDIIPSGWSKIKLYETTGNLSTTTMTNTINSGIGFCHFVGHGNESAVYLGFGGSYLTSGDVESLSNGSKLGIYNSISCFHAAIDQATEDCFAEYFLIEPDGGGVATIMNSRYGWEGDVSHLGPSESIDSSFFHEIFSESYDGHYSLGVAHAMSKDRYVPEVSWTEYWALCIYQLNLFGDPELDVWTDEPVSLTVAHPAEISEADSTFEVEVLHGSVPVEDARVCALKNTEVYDISYTDVNGISSVIMRPGPATVGTLLVTCTAHNYKPYEGIVHVVEAGTEVRDLPLILVLSQNSPNPFSKLTTIGYQVSARADISIKIYDLTGRLMRTLTDGRHEPGCHRTRWLGNDEQGKQVSNGVYFVRLRQDGQDLTRRAVLLR